MPCSDLEKFEEFSFDGDMRKNKDVMHLQSRDVLQSQNLFFMYSIFPRFNNNKDHLDHC